MDLVGSIRIPDYQLAVLGGRDEMSTVGSPMHGINLGKMTAESAARAHDNAR